MRRVRRHEAVPDLFPLLLTRGTITGVRGIRVRVNRLFHGGSRGAYVELPQHTWATSNPAGPWAYDFPEIGLC